ncbi:MAG: V-type ATP synthase subunit F [Candidatus Omnitrophota bacterium]
MPSMPEGFVVGNALAIIGDEDIVLGFSALGFKVYTAKEIPQFEKALEDIVNNQTGVCLVQDNIYQAQEERINSYKKMPLPIFIPFSKDGGTDFLDKMVKGIQIRATGAL